MKSNLLKIKNLVFIVFLLLSSNMLFSLNKDLGLKPVEKRPRQDFESHFGSKLVKKRKTKMTEDQIKSFFKRALNLWFDKDNLQSQVNAAIMFKEAAEWGFPPAQNSIGVAYLLGRGIGKNYEEALKWFKLAAENGHDIAEYNVGLMYFEGYGVEKDFRKAIDWFYKSLEKNDKAAEKLKRIAKDGSSSEQEYLCLHCALDINISEENNSILVFPDARDCILLIAYQGNRFAQNIIENDYYSLDVEIPKWPRTIESKK